MRVSMLNKGMGGSLSLVLGVVLIAGVVGIAGDVGEKKLTKPEGMRLLENKSFDDSDEARGEILELYKDLRVTDVSDGMDAMGLQDIGLMDKSIRPLWRDVDKFTHRVVGFAITVRYVPTDVRVGEGSFEHYQRYKRWVAQQYKRSAFERWTGVIRPGDVAVIDAADVREGGHTGSNNSLAWASKGLVGVVTNNGVRDTDEIAKVKRIAVYCKDGYSSRGIVPGRLLCESFNFPINCGGALVYPGDVIVADGDGVIVVPREHALEVGRIAKGINVEDEAGRARKYEGMGIEADSTVIIEGAEEKKE